MTTERPKKRMGIGVLMQKMGRSTANRSKQDFWTLSGSLKSKVSLTDKELRSARESFGKNWSQKHDVS